MVGARVATVQGAKQHCARVGKRSSIVREGSDARDLKLTPSVRHVMGPPLNPRDDPCDGNVASCRCARGT